MIFFYNQVSLFSCGTLVSKLHLDSFARNHEITIIHCHDDNGVFSSNEFKNHYQKRDQTFDFSGTGVHNNNTRVERYIQTETQWARSMVIYVVLYWIEQEDKATWTLMLE